MRLPGVFFDTDVLLDLASRREPWVRAAALLRSFVDAGQSKGFVSAISFNNMYYVLRKGLSKANALAGVRDVMAGLVIVPLDCEILAWAMDADLPDFEDAIQYASAQRSGADYLVTRNVRDFPRGVPEIVLPEDLLERLNLS